MTAARMNLLLVEDDPQIQRFLVTALDAHGYALAIAGSGAEGLKLAALRQPDILIVDLGLPDMSGLDVIRRVPDAALSFIYLLHPDPWPKARHAKRRMVNDGPIDLFAAKLRPNGEFRLATDDPTYLNWSLMVMQRHAPQFEWLAERPADFLEPSGGWIETRYGAKSLREGRRPYYLRYRRLSG